MAIPTQEELDRQRESLNIERAMADVVRKGTEEIAKQRAALQERVDQGDLNNSSLQRQIELLDKLSELGEDALKTLIKENNEKKKNLNLTEKQINSQQKLQAVVEKQLSISEGLMGELNKFGLGWIKSLKDQIKSHKDLSKSMNAVLKAQNFVNFAANSYLKTAIDLIYRNDQMRSGFFKATQASDAMGQTLLATSDNLRAMGLSFETAGPAMTALINETVAFKNASQATQEEMATTVAILDQAGVSSNTSAEAFHVLTKVMGRDIKRAGKDMARFANIAETLDITMTQFSQDFINASKSLSAHGPKMEKVFIGLQAQARATGTSMSALLQVAGQFDTFEGSADAVSKLNGILGGPYLNSIEMVYMSEEKRIDAIRKSLQMSGRQFASMGKYERLAIANAAGITDMNQAMELFGTSTAEFEKRRIEAEKAAEKEKDLAAAAKKATDIQNNLANSFRSLIIEMKPFIDSVVKVVNTVTEYISGLEESEKETLGWGVALGAVFTNVAANAATAYAEEMLLNGALSATNAIMTGGAGKGVGLHNAITAFGTKLMAMASTVKAATLALVGSISLPVVAAVAGVTLAVGAIYYFWDEIKAGWEKMMSWWNSWSFDGLVESVSRAFQDIADMLPQSPVKMGPLVGLEQSGEKIPEMLSKGVKKGIKVNVVPQMEALATHQKVQAASAAIPAPTAATTLTPTRTQAQTKQPVQLVIDYKGVKRLLAEVQMDLLGEAVDLRLA